MPLVTEMVYLVAAQGCKDESFFPHNAIWELLLPILVPSTPQGKGELGQLGFAELRERPLLSISKGRKGELFAPTD